MNKVDRYIIWDFDGTLAYRPGGWSGALAAVLKEYDPSTTVTDGDIRPFLQSGFPWHAPEIQHAGLAADEWWAEMQPVFSRAFRSVGTEPSAARAMAARVRSSYLDLTCWERFSDALPTLKSLSLQGWRHILLSNHVPELPIIIEYLGFASCFSAVFNSAQTGWEKPNRHAFHLAQDWISARLQPGSRSSAWVIGDSITSDIKGAQEAGLPAILVRVKNQDVPVGTLCIGSLPILLSMLN